ncbi:hypothetical protein HDU96_000161, partial [Phlyctochytrium bullatum]
MSGSLSIPYRREFKALDETFRMETETGSAVVDKDSPLQDRFLSLRIQNDGILVAKVQRYPRQTAGPPSSCRIEFKARIKKSITNRVLQKPAKEVGKKAFQDRLDKRRAVTGPSYNSFSPLETVEEMMDYEKIDQGEQARESQAMDRDESLKGGEAMEVDETLREDEAMEVDESLGEGEATKVEETSREGAAMKEEIARDEKLSRAVDRVYKLAYEHAGRSAQGQNSQTAESMVKDVVTHIEVMVVTVQDVPGSVVKPDTSSKNHGVPPDSRPREPTPDEIKTYKKINVGDRNPRPKAKHITEEQEVKAIIAVLGFVEACLRRMIIAYYLTALVAADYYLEKLAKVSYLPKCLTTVNNAGQKPDAGVNSQIRDLIRSISGVTADHVEDFYTDLVNELINLPEQKDRESTKVWTAFFEYLEWWKLVISDGHDDTGLMLPTSSDFCERRKAALDFILVICLGVYHLCCTGRMEGVPDSVIVTKLKKRFSLPSSVEGGVAKTRNICKAILRRNDGGKSEPDKESGDSTKMVTLTCSDRENYDHANVPGASEAELNARLSPDQAQIWKTLIDGKLSFRFLWCKEKKAVSFRKLFRDIRAILFPSAEDEAECMKSQSQTLRSYWGYTFHVVAPTTPKTEGESKAEGENEERIGESPKPPEKLTALEKGNKRASEESPKAEDDEPGEDDPKQAKNPGIEQAIKGLLSSIQTVFVVRDRPFMTKFGELFGEYAGCELGSGLVASVIQAVKGEIDGWGKAVKYTWTSLLQHPMILRLFPDEDKNSPKIQMNPEGKYVIEPVKLLVGSRDMDLFQLKNGEAVRIKKGTKTKKEKNDRIRRESKNAKVARLTGADFGLYLGLSATVTVPKNNQIKRTWGEAKLAVNKNDDIVLSIPFKVEGCGKKIKKDGQCRKYSKPQDKPVTNPRRADPDEEILLSEEDYPFEFY